jgi:hypothetical protein
MISRILARCALVTLVLAAPCAAQAKAAEIPDGWSLPTVAHEGTRIMRAEGVTAESAFRYLPPGKQREEMTHEGMSVAIIIRPDLGVTWTLLPGNIYMEMALGDADASGSHSPSTPSTEGVVSFEELGKEEVGGWPTTRYRVVTRDEGEESEGYFWMTEHWIPIRMEFSSRGNPAETVIMEIRNLQIRDQDPALFEVPAGATKMSGLGGMSGSGAGAFGFGAELASEATETARDTAQQETREGVKNAVREGVRGLFKR